MYTFKKDLHENLYTLYLIWYNPRVKTLKKVTSIYVYKN